MVAGALEFVTSRTWMPGMLLLLPLLPSIGYWAWRGARRKEAALAQFAGLRQAAAHLHRQRVGEAALIGAGLLAAVLGSAGPLWGRHPAATPITTRDLWIVLDLSRSMLAEDHPPYGRTERAQRHLRNLIAKLRGETGIRVGLIVFAGKAKVACPLTDDYEYFDHALTLARPELLDHRLRLADQPDGSAQGTSIAAGLALLGNLMDPERAGFQDALLVSDGDDLAGGWEAELARVHAGGVRVHCLGVGDPERAAFIPTGRADQPFVLDGEGDTKATTRRHDEVLAAIARQGQGAFLVEESGPEVLADWFKSTIAAGPRYVWDGDRRYLATHQCGWFFAAAMVCWSLAWALGVLRVGREQG